MLHTPSKPVRPVLIDPLFLSALGLLLLNDLYLKHAYGNWFTGKLSDVCGLFIFPIFWAAFFPHYRKHIYAATTLFFIYWKCSLSDPLLNAFHYLHLPVYRIVDYSDLFALLVLPFSYRLSIKKITTNVKPWLINIAAVLSFFSFCATSYARPLYANVEVKHSVSGDRYLKVTKQEYIDRLQQAEITHQLVPYPVDTARHHSGTSREKDYLVVEDIVVDSIALSKVFIAIGTVAEKKHKAFVKIFGYELKNEADTIKIESNKKFDDKLYKKLVDPFAK